MQGPHDLSPVYTAGEPLKEAAGAVVLLHGRGSNAGDILGLSRAFTGMKLAFVAPQAAGNVWYPQRFIAPREMNEPDLSSALTKVKRVVDGLVGSGIPTERIVIAGFSQGACLASEFVASNPARYASLIAFTGGLIGPLGSDLHHDGDLAGTPALFLCGDPDPHIPFVRVEESVEELKRMGAKVSLHRYPGKPHNVSAEELEQARILLQKVFSQKSTN
jgi:predicted esterase